MTVHINVLVHPGVNMPRNPYKGKPTINKEALKQLEVIDSKPMTEPNIPQTKYYRDGMSTTPSNNIKKEKDKSFLENMKSILGRDND